jgi:nitrogen fixation protein FixH
MDGSAYNAPPHHRVPQRSAWRFFPLGVVLVLTLVAVANGVMIYFAESTFPGEAVKDDFALNNDYTRILAAQKAQNALGWRLDIGAEAGVPVLRLAGPDGKPLAGLAVSAVAARALGPRLAAALRFAETAPGVYRADRALSERGNWDIDVLAAGGGGTVREVLHLLIP